MSRVFTLSLFPFLLSGPVTYAQFISNMSFEGVPQENVPPQGWTPCNQYSTPDTQPGFWEVTGQPSHGKTYISLVTRGNLGPYANYTEAVQTALLIPLSKSRVYNMMLDLALSMEFGHYADFDFLRYDTPAKLRISGGLTACEKSEVLWESPLIDHPDWRRYAFNVQPINGNINYLILEAVYTGNVTYFGNVLLDNISFTRSCNDAIPIATQAFDSLICENDTLLIDASTPDGSYIWSNGSTESSITVTSAGVVMVEVSNGCDSKTFEYRIEEEACNCEITAPNIFTPNSDGFNETFVVSGTSDIARYDLRIFNRWGQLVFETREINNHWDGFMNGSVCASGVYFWTIDMMCIINGNSIVDRSYKGSITVSY